MQRVKFVLLTVLILLSGAALSGLAAWKVVTPAVGETVNAGVLSVPSVLGQTANEVLFYPWPVYDMQTLSPISEADLEKYDLGYPFDLFAAIVAMDALGAEFDLETLVRSQQVYDGRGLGAGRTELRYVKDFPASLGDVPVLLNYAQSQFNPSAVSWLMHPVEQTELSEQQQQEALNKVQNDLAGLIWYLIEPDRNYSNDLMVFLENFNTLQDSAPMFYEWACEWMDLMYTQYYGGYNGGGFEAPDAELSVCFTIHDDEQEQEPEPPPYTLEELLAMGQGDFVDIQFISTPRQIVLLFNLDSGRIVGLYYDIQLGCYSGLGLNGI